MKNYLLLFFIALLLSFASCSDTGVYYYLHRETLIEKNNLPYGVTFWGTGGITASGTDNVFGWGKTLWYLDLGPENVDSRWDKIARPPTTNSNSSTYSSAVTLGNQLYVVQRNSSSKVTNVYRNEGTLRGPDWKALFLYDELDKEVEFYNYYLFAVGGNLYVNRVKSSLTQETVLESKLFLVNSPDTIEKSIFANVTTPISVDSTYDLEEPKPVSDMSYDGSDYWLIFNRGSVNVSDDGLLARSADGLTFTPQQMPNGRNKIYNRLLSFTNSEGQQLLIITSSGSRDDTENLVYCYNIATDTWGTGSLDNKRFSEIGDISYLMEDHLFLGTVSYRDPSGGSSLINSSGLYLLDVSNPTDISISSLPRDMEGNYVSTSLFTGTIHSFYIDEVNDKIYTSADSGVWVNESADNDSRVWVLENEKSFDRDNY